MRNDAGYENARGRQAPGCGPDGSQADELCGALPPAADAGGAVLSWIIEGAEKAIKNKYKLKTPMVVEAAINKYRENNDWFSAFVDECCEVDVTFQKK